MQIFMIFVLVPATRYDNKIHLDFFFLLDFCAYAVRKFEASFCFGRFDVLSFGLTKDCTKEKKVLLFLFSRSKKDLTSKNNIY